MSDFITTMAARASGEITKVEPLISSMFLPLPPMPGDYVEDMYAEPEPPESLEDDPDLSFLPLLNYDPWSVEIPNWYENEDFEVEETEGENSPESLHRERNNEIESAQNLPEKLANKNTSDSNLNTEIKVIESEVILREKDRGFQSKEEVSNYSATPQGNSLDTESLPVKVNGKLNPLVSKNKSELTQVSNDNQLNISIKLTDGDNQEIFSPSTEDIQSTITPQVNRLETASPSLQAKINSNPSIANTESELTTPSDENKRKANQQITNLDNRDTRQSSTDENLPNITTQVSRLGAESPSLQAKINSNSSISKTESELTTLSDNHQATESSKLNSLENSENNSSTIAQEKPSATKTKKYQLESAELNTDLTQRPNDNLPNISKESTNLEHQETNVIPKDETSPKITPAINRLELESLSIQAKAERDPSIYNTKFDSNPISENSQVNKKNNFPSNLDGQDNKISNANQVKVNRQLNNLVNDVSSPEDKLSNITPQVHRLEAKYIPAQASLDSHASIPNKESDLNKVSDDDSLQIHKEFTDLDNGEIRKSSQDYTSPTITPQVNRLETESSSLQANVESNPSVLNTELELTKIFDDNQANTSSKVTGSENREINSSAITPQINRLEKVSESVKANVESHSPVVHTNHNLIQSSDNHQEKVNQILTNSETREANTSSQEEKKALTVTPQVNRLDTTSLSSQANLDSRLSIVDNELEFTKVDSNNQAKENHKSTNLEHQEISTPFQEERLSSIHNKLTNNANAKKKNISSRQETPPSIKPPINRLETVSPSTEAKVKPNLSTSNANNSPKEQKQLTKNLGIEKQNNSSINETSSSVALQVSRSAENLLSTYANEKVSRGNIESNQNEQVSKIGKQHKINPSSASPSESNSVSNNRNSSLISPLRQLGKLINRSNNKQKQKQSDSTRKKIGGKTVTPNLQNNSAPLATSQENSNIQEQRLSHINQLNPGKESVKPELKSDASYSLANTTSSDNAKNQNNVQQSNSPRTQKSLSNINSSQTSQSSQNNQFKHREENRTKLPKEKITPQQKVEARLDQSVNSLSSSTSTSLNSEHSLRDTKKLKSPVSEVDQSSSSPQQNSILSNPHNANLNLNTVKNAPNTKHIPNYVSKNESKLNSNDSSIKPNINESISVITNQENYPNLSSPKSSKISPVNNQTEPRQNQSKYSSSPTIQITIGRIEVKGNQAPPSPKSTTRKSTKRNPSLSLQDYLKQRDGK